MEMAEEAELKDGMERDGWNGDDGKLRPAWGEEKEGPGGELAWVEQMVTADCSEGERRLQWFQRAAVENARWS